MFMIKRWLRKYFATVFVLATLMGVFHHHGDLQVHEDCKICVVQLNLANGDTPQEVKYLTLLDIRPTRVETFTQTLYHFSASSSLYARAPPQYS